MIQEQYIPEQIEKKCLALFKFNMDELYHYSFFHVYKVAE